MPPADTLKVAVSTRADRQADGGRNDNRWRDRSHREGRGNAGLGPTAVIEEDLVFVSILRGIRREAEGRRGCGWHVFPRCAVIGAHLPLEIEIGCADCVHAECRETAEGDSLVFGLGDNVRRRQARSGDEQINSVVRGVVNQDAMIGGRVARQGAQSQVSEGVASRVAHQRKYRVAAETADDGDRNRGDALGRDGFGHDIGGNGREAARVS